MMSKTNWREAGVLVDEEPPAGCRTEEIAITPVPEAEAPPPSLAVAPLLIPITVPRDLAVQLVGSDAGKQKRSRPTSVMTKGATPEEVAAVEMMMGPFLQDEITRFHENRNHHPMVFNAEATMEQARASKKFCMAYAAHLRKHLERHDHDDRHHRSQQRLNQTYSVIARINTALGTHFDDGRSLADCQRDLVAHMQALQENLDNYLARTVSMDLDSGKEFSLTERPLFEFAQIVRQQLARLKSLEPADSRVK